MATVKHISTVLIAAGGTGGHVFPALAVAERLQLEEVPIIWLGTYKGLESKVVPAAGIKFLPLAVSGFRGKGVIDRVNAVYGLFKAIFYVVHLIRKERVAVVLGMGGYASLAAGLASTVCRKPLVIQEQNAVLGTANRLLARFAERIFSGFPLGLKYGDKVEFSGNPVRKDLLEFAGNKRTDQNQLALENFSITIIGGSLGAQAINELIPQALRELRGLIDADGFTADKASRKIQIKHQSGVAHRESVSAAYVEIRASLGAQFDVSVVDFISDMHAVLAASDIVIARAGALTLAELQIFGVPSILIPLPSAIDDHQKINALYMENHGAAVLLEQKNATPKVLAQMIHDFYHDSDALGEMAKSAARVAKPDASSRVAAYCMELCNG